MNLSLYAAVDRTGLGLAVTLEFLGPLAVAIAGSRRLPDLAGPSRPTSAWWCRPTPVPPQTLRALPCTARCGGLGCYILLNRTVDWRLPGLQGTTVTSINPIWAARTSWVFLH